MPAAPLPKRLLRELGHSARERVTTAHEYANTHIADIARRTGESYAEHGIEVAVVLREIMDDPSMLCVVILHDLLIHPAGDALLENAPLTDDEKQLVRDLHPLRRLQIDAHTEQLHKVIDAFERNPRLLPVRMAHRLNDVRHIDRFDGALHRKIAHETLHMYAAIAGNLGMYRWRMEMENICFRLLQPSIAARLETKLAAVRELDNACLKHAKRHLEKKMEEAGIDCQITVRIKELYSMYRKMAIKGRTFEELTDRLALRIIVRERRDCYLALGIVHEAFNQIPGKLKDYIGAPKENGYRSIHTVVYPLAGVTEQPIEIQIRTEAMHLDCELGMARHGDYKHELYALDTGSARVDLFRNLQGLREEAQSPRQFTTVLRTYFREDYIVLFDENDNLYHLKHPLNALDFVCHVHGVRCALLRGVKINGRKRHLATALRDGDTIEVAFGKTHAVQPDWLDACKYARAKAVLKKVMERQLKVQNTRKVAS